MGLDHVRCDIKSDKFSSTTFFRPGKRRRDQIDAHTRLEDHGSKLRTAGKQGLKDLVGSLLMGVRSEAFARRIKRKAQDSKLVQAFQMILQ